MAAVALVLASAAGAADVLQVLRRVQWRKFKQANQLPAGEVIPPGPEAEFEQLRIAAEGPTDVTLATIESPAITADRYAVIGSVRYGSVGGQGYAEMWSHFPDGSKFSTRTLAPSGPTGVISGSSGWRELRLPFDRSEADASPVKLVINLHLPEGGTVHLSPLRLVQYTPIPPRAWWSSAAGGWIGGVGGTLLGVLCAAGALLTVRGAPRGTLMGPLTAMLLAGTGGLAAGLVAAITGQPYAVTFPLLLLGALYEIMAVGGFVLLRARLRAG